MNEHHTGIPQITSITIAGIVNMLTSFPFNLTQKDDIAPALHVSESTLSHWINRKNPYQTLYKDNYEKFLSQLKQWCGDDEDCYCDELCSSFPELQSYVSTSSSSSTKKTMIDLLIKKSLDHHYEELCRSRNKNSLTEEFPMFSDDPQDTTNATTSADPAPVYELGSTLISQGASKGAFWVREPARNKEYLVTPQNALPPNMSALPTYVPGSRAETIAAIKKSLEKGEHVFLNGLPGQGKTQTAIRAAMELNPEKGAYLINYTAPKKGDLDEPQYEAMEETVLHIPFTGYQYMPSRSEMTMLELRQEDFNNRLSILTSQYKNAIFIIDNFDGQSLDQILAEKSLRKMLSCGLRLIFTTRHSCVDWRPSWKIEPLTEPEQMLLMKTFCGETWDEAELCPLLSAVDGNTLLIVLMGKVLSSNRKLTPKILLEQLEKHSLSTLNSTVSHEWHGNDDDRGDYKREQLYAHMRALFDISQFIVGEKKLLAHAILFPNSGIDCSLFESCLVEDDTDNLSHLLECGWLSLQKETNLLQIHPAAREVCINELHPDDDVCEMFLNNLADHYDPQKYDAAKYLQIAECFANAHHILPDLRGEWAHLAGGCYNIIGDYAKSLGYFKNAVSLRERDLSKNNPEIALTYRSLACAYAHQGNFEEARNFLEKTKEIQENILPENDLDLSYTYVCIGANYRDLGEYEKSLNFFQKAQIIQEDVLPENHSELAETYTGIATIHGCLGDYCKSLEFLGKVQVIQENTLPNNHPDLAETYRLFGDFYGNLGDNKESLKYYEKARNIQEEILPNTHPDLANTYNGIGVAYGKLGDFENALIFLVKAQNIEEEIFLDNHPHLATTYSNIGWVYVKKGDFGEACAFFEKARSIQEITLRQNHPDLATTFDNLGFSYGELGDTNKQLEFYEKARIIQEETLPHYHPDLAVTYNNIGHAYGKSGEYEKSFEYLKKAHAIGDATATHNLGWMYLNGYGVEQDLAQAIELFTIASDYSQRSDVHSCFHLGLIYLGVHPQALDFEDADPVKALHYLERAKKLGAADTDDFIQQAKSMVSKTDITEN